MAHYPIRYSTDDPTRAALDAITGPDWMCLTGVPIFRAHTRDVPGPDDQTITVTVTDDDLDEIAAIARALEDEEGVLMRVTDGHLDPKKPEGEQGELWGFAAGARVGTFGPKSVRAVLVDLYLRRDKLPQIRERPYRSVEYYPATREIRGVALLIRDPHLDLGILTYSRDRRAFALHYGAPPMPDPTMDDEKKKSMGGTPDDKGDKGPWPDEKEEAMYQRFKARYSAEMSGGDEEEDEMPAPGGEPSPVPGMGDRDKPMGYSKDPVVYKMQVELEALRTEKARAECREMLRPLEALNYSFDPAREVTLMLPMNGKQRANHVAYIKTHARQRPGSAPIGVYTGNVEGGAVESGAMTAAEMDTALAYQRDNKTTWAAAVKAVKKSQ